MLPVKVSPAQSKVLFDPDDLRAHPKSDLFQTRCNFAGMDAGMPDISDVSREEFIRSGPIHLVIVAHHADLSLLTQARTLPPLRIVLHAIRGIGHQQNRHRSSKKPADVLLRRSIPADHPMLTAEPEITRLCYGFAQRDRNLFLGWLLVG